MQDIKTDSIYITHWKRKQLLFNNHFDAFEDNKHYSVTEVYNFSVKLLLKRTKINKKEAGVGPFF